MDIEIGPSPGWMQRTWSRLRGGHALLQVLQVAMVVAFWILVGLGVMVLIVDVFLVFVPGDKFRLTFTGSRGGTEVPILKGYVLAGLAGVAAYLGAFALILHNLGQMISTLRQGDPFHPDNVRRLKRVGLILAAAAGGAWVGQAILAQLSRGAADSPGLFGLITPVFSVLIVFILAEVFREGARLRRESELTI
jgi:hypothetical protein